MNIAELKRLYEENSGGTKGAERFYKEAYSWLLSLLEELPEEKIVDMFEREILTGTVYVNISKDKIDTVTVSFGRDYHSCDDPFTIDVPNPYHPFDPRGHLMFEINLKPENVEVGFVLVGDIDESGNNSKEFLQEVFGDYLLGWAPTEFYVDARFFEK